MKKHNKKINRISNAGITLISLVITIIVLLILAGVIINIMLNQDNLFAKANEAKSSWNKQANTENSLVNDYMAKIDQYINGTAPTATATSGGGPTPTATPSNPWRNLANANEVIPQLFFYEVISESEKTAKITGMNIDYMLNVEYNWQVYPENDPNGMDNCPIWVPSEDITTADYTQHRAAIQKYARKMVIPQTVNLDGDSYVSNNGEEYRIVSIQLMDLHQNREDPNTQEIYYATGWSRWGDCMSDYMIYASYGSQIEWNFYIPEGVTRIEDACFDNLNTVHSISFPDSLVSIGGDIFGGSTFSPMSRSDTLT